MPGELDDVEFAFSNDGVNVVYRGRMETLN